ncbi:unnamed protein product [Callosobruchus maculatus]|uniref:Large ribosomal subunit protein uL10 n=1 Tax=Callosobruchus maculatus TaxID=64391 RepID=A0A653D3Y2_CALMS|nr:unnamed protein product [Callosobruchus maculatus]
MGREDKATWKANYFNKLIQLLEDYPKCFIVGADNVGSKQMQQIRISLRGNAVILMGKYTMMRKAIKGHLERNPALEKLLPHIKGNVGFVFTRNDLVEIRDKLLENKVRAPARAGAIAPLPVVIPAQNTGLGPENMSLFKALSIPTKISKGTIEIISVANLAAVCLAVGYPTAASVPHNIANGFKNLLAIAVVTEIEFKEATTIKEYLKDLCKFAAVAAAPATKAAKAAETKKEEKEESDQSDDEMGFGLFD